MNVFLPNAAELGHLRALGVPEPFAPLTVVKQGAQGATAISGDEELSASGQRVNAVDTTGAGDAFNAGFLSAWLTNMPLLDCLKAGNAKGAQAVSGRGGMFQGAPAGSGRDHTR